MNGEPVVLLLVEDNEDHAVLALRSLQASPVVKHVVHVRDGEEALDYLYRRGAYTDPKNSPRPHVVLLDLRLPKMDGLEVLQRIKADETLCRIPVVVLSTSEAEVDVARAYAYHANSYLVKPLNPKDFPQMMTDLGFHWPGWNRSPGMMQSGRRHGV